MGSYRICGINARVYEVTDPVLCSEALVLELDVLYMFSSLYITSLASLVSALADFRTGSLPHWLAPVILTLA